MVSGREKLRTDPEPLPEGKWMCHLGFLRAWRDVTLGI